MNEPSGFVVCEECEGTGISECTICGKDLEECDCTEAIYENCRKCDGKGEIWQGKPH